MFGNIVVGKMLVNSLTK